MIALLLLAFLGLCQQAQCQQQAGGGTCFDTLSSRIEGNEQLTYFQRALSETDLDLSLQGPGPYLVFAPTDAAFENLQGSVLELDLTKLIAYHISAGGYDRFLGLSPGAPPIDIKSLCDDCGDVRVELQSNGQVLVNGEARALQSVETCNGVLITVDAILNPEVPDSLEAALGECSPEDPTCCDLPPPEFDCALQKEFGKCNERWMLVGNGNGEFCQFTCGRCPGAERPSFDDYENNNFGGDSDDDYGFDDDYFGTDDDPCRCTEDGVSGGVETGQSGCFAISAEIVTSMATNAGRRIGESLSQFFGKDSYEFAKHFGGFWTKEAGAWARENMGRATKRACYVADPQACEDARASSEYVGAAWRSCD